MAASALALVGMVVEGTQAHAAATPQTVAACSNRVAGTNCTISIADTTSALYKNEGQSINVRVNLGRSKAVQLRAFGVVYDAAGKPIGVRAIGPAVTVRTDTTGHARAAIPTQALPAGLTGWRDAFLVQTADFTSAAFLAGDGIPNAAGKWPLFSLRSARPAWTGSEKYTSISGTRFEYRLQYGIPGHKFQMQANYGGTWYNITKPTTSATGVINSSGNTYLSWQIPSSWGTGIYNTRVVNLSKGGLVVINSKVTLYGSPKGVWGDHDGDRRADILGVDSYGRLSVYITRGGPALSPAFRVGSGWSSMNWMATLPDMDGNGYSELVARRSDGTLWLYRGKDFGTYGSAVQIGRGWAPMSLMTVLPDINGDRQPELVARTTKGDLLRYRLTLKGANYVNRVGPGWGGMTRLLSPGDVSGDGRADLLGIRKDGLLFQYTLRSNGSASSTRAVGRGWTPMNQAYSPGDMEGDGRRDLVGKRSDGKLFFYRNLGRGKWGSARQIGSGWGSVRLMA